MLSRTLFVLSVAALGAITLTPAAPAAATQAATAPAGAAQAVTAASAFERLTSLSGTWEGTVEGEGGPTRITYRTISGGRAVLETLFPGTPHEMISIYLLEGNELRMTHYCAVGNQPRMKLKAGGTSNVLAFDFKDATNLKSDKDGHMHSLVLTFKDDDHVSAAWQYYQDGKAAADHQATFEMARVKDADAAAKIITAAATSCCSTKEGAACCDSGVKAEKKDGKN